LDGWQRRDRLQSLSLNGKRFENSNAAPVITGITGTSYTNTGLNSGTTYYYEVVATNSSGLSGFQPKPTRRPLASPTRRNSILKLAHKVGREAVALFPEWRLQPRRTSPAISRWP